MSRLHVTQNGQKKTFHLKDGKDILDRFVNLDTGSMYYFMGKQIAGKPINPNGALGKKLRRIADEIMQGKPLPESRLTAKQERNLRLWKRMWWVFPLMALWFWWMAK